MTDLLRLLDEVYRGPAWHGPSVKESLESVTAKVARQKLSPERNSIWELVLHLAHGRHLLIERVDDAPSEPFPRTIREPWWPVIGYETSDDAWRTDLQLLDDTHAKFIDAVRRATPKQLARHPQGATHVIADQLLGMAVHDAYHAGQIRLLAIQFGAQNDSP
jgi:hypothetical protein